ncbi:MAG TPA: DUF4760 domain-containing protein [Rhabdaerophilum sp.]|nr:DUF4760 domain-containing protein [Rhabdaerophilum sp.]
MNIAYIQPITTLIVGIAAACVASWAIQTNRQIAKKKATIDFFSKFDIEQYSQSQIQDEQIYEILASCNDDNVSKEQMDVLKRDFYKYELMAIGIFEGILDEDICKMYVGHTICLYDKFNVSLIQAQRATLNNKAIFENVEKLIKKWKPLFPETNS